MFTSEGEIDAERLHEELTPEQLERLRTATRLLINYLLDNAPVNRQNEIQKDTERSIATVPRAVQLHLEF